MINNILMIYNPNSGKGRGAKYANKLKKQLEKRGAVVGNMFCCKSVQAATEFCIDNSGNPCAFSLAIIIGGDGTLSPWIDGMIKHDFNVPVYAYGRGTANDFASFMRTNKRARRAARIICNNPRTRDIDILHVNNEQYAINVACGGAFTNGVTKYSKRSKKLFGKLAYIFKGMRDVFKMRAQDIEVMADGKEILVSTYLFLILNTTNAGSIKKIAPLARPWDGMFNIVALKKCGLFGKLGMFFSIVFKRAHKSKNILNVSATEITVKIKGDPNSNFTCTDIDGNVGGPYPLDVKIHENKVIFVANTKSL